MSRYHSPMPGRTPPPDQRLPPLSGQDLLHPLAAANAQSLHPTNNVFAEQEKAFFKRNGLPYDPTRSPGTPTAASPLLSPIGMLNTPTTPTHDGSGGSPTSPRPSPSSSNKYANIPPYRTTPVGSVAPTQNSGPSNQFGVLVPGWGVQQDRGEMASADRNGESSTGGGGGMQFVPVVTKGSGAPGRGPTKRKKA